MGVEQSLTPREEHRLRVPEKRKFRRIFGSRRKCREVRGYCVRLVQSSIIHTLHQTIIKVIGEDYVTGHEYRAGGKDMSCSSRTVKLKGKL
jgi:hypothetical protein